MHNLKEIRKNFSEFEKSLEKRSVNIDFSNLQKLDKENIAFLCKTYLKAIINKSHYS